MSARVRVLGEEWSRLGLIGVLGCLGAGGLVLLVAFMFLSSDAPPSRPFSREVWIQHTGGFSDSDPLRLAMVDDLLANGLELGTGWDGVLELLGPPTTASPADREMKYTLGVHRGPFGFNRRVDWLVLRFDKSNRLTWPFVVSQPE